MNLAQLPERGFEQLRISTSDRDRRPAGEDFNALFRGHVARFRSSEWAQGRSPIQAYWDLVKATRPAGAGAVVVDLKGGATALALGEFAVSVDDDPDTLQWIHLCLPLETSGDRLPEDLLARVVDRVTKRRSRKLRRTKPIR